MGVLTYFTTLETDTAAKGGVSFEFCVVSIVDPDSILDPFNTRTCANF